MTVNRSCRLRSAGVAAVAILAAMTLAGAAKAGECPADKRITDATKPVDTPAKGVTDTVLATIDLSKEKVALPDHLLRIRRLVIQPGGIVPWHSHGDRPALIYIIRGEIYEYASDCAVPILHKAGEATSETHTTAHWWKNTSNKPCVLISADLMHDKNDHNM